MFGPKALVIRGPLVPFVAGFWDELIEVGYARDTARNHLCLMADLSRWLKDAGVPPEAFTSERVREFLTARRSQGLPYYSPKGAAPLLGYLRGLNAVPPAAAPAVDESPMGRLLAEYERYLLEHRCVRKATAKRLVVIARRLLGERTEVGSLTADEVITFVLDQSKRDGGKYSSEPASRTRSLLRFLEIRGLIEPHIAACIPPVKSWRLTGVPRALTAEQLQAVFAAVNSDSALDRRNRAIVLLMVRLGLRANELAALRLDDINWRSGELTIFGKGAVESVLPLPPDVGEGLVDHLRHRPAKAIGRHVFLRSRAPFQALSTHGIAVAAASTMRRAGIPSGGAHLLRHTMATRLLNAGASLPEIGRLLRHRSINTTAIYAKLDDDALRELARPWPGGVR